MRLASQWLVVFAAGCSEGARTSDVVSNDMVVETPNVAENQVFNTAAPVITNDVADNAIQNFTANQVDPDNPLANETFVASGNEPFWTISVDTRRAKLTTPEDQKGTWFPVTRVAQGNTVTIKGTVNGKPLTLYIDRKPCADDMSGAKFPFTSRLSATLASGPGSWSGCARRLRDPQPKPE